MTALLTQASRGSREAAELVAEQIYPELHHLARKLMLGERSNHTLQASGLVHEAYLRLFDISQIEYQSRAHFFAVAAQQMRRILVDYARSRSSRKRGGDRCRVTLTGTVAATEDQAVDILALNDLLGTLAELSPRQARVIELRYFAGLDCNETASVLGVDARTVKRDWQMARSWLQIHLAP